MAGSRYFGAMQGMNGDMTNEQSAKNGRVSGRHKERIATFAPMNCDDEIIKRKLYYDGLKQVIENPIPKKSADIVDEALEDEDTEEGLKETLRLWKEVFAPLCNAIVFVHNNRFLLDEKDEIANGDDADLPFMLPDEIFKTLKTLLKSTVMEFLSVLQIGSSEKKDLFDRIVQNDPDGFITMLEQHRCDTTPLAKLCSSCLDDSFRGENMEDEDLPYLLDYMAGRLKNNDAEDSDVVLEAVERWQPSSELINTDDSDETLYQYFSDYRHFIETNLGVFLRYYWDLYDDFLLKERNLIEPILDHPIAKDLIDRIWEEYQNPKPKPSETCTLPDDFFEWQHKANTPKEYFYMDDAFKKQGVETFVAFINWLADKGYIADDNDVKALFAYRLTGRCRPEGKELPVIEWHGKNNKPYELIYIVRNFSDRGDYRKMRLFFQGPEWVKDRDSSYSNSADSEFKRQMAEFYPEACDFRKHYIAKGI